MSVNTIGRAVFFAWALMFVTVAQADILVSNLDQPFRANTPIANPEFWGAQSFLTDANSYALNSIDVIVGNGVGSPLVVAELRASTGVLGEIDMSPTGLLGTFIAPDLSGPTSVRTFVPNGSILLNASTLYWFVLGSANGGTYDWSYANSNITSGPGLLGTSASSSTAGGTWVYADDQFPYFIQVNTSGIPEPVAAPLIGALILGYSCLARRRK